MGFRGRGHGTIIKNHRLRRRGMTSERSEKRTRLYRRHPCGQECVVVPQGRLYRPSSVSPAAIHLLQGEGFGAVSHYANSIIRKRSRQRCHSNKNFWKSILLEAVTPGDPVKMCDPKSYCMIDFAKGCQNGRGLPVWSMLSSSAWFTRRSDPIAPNTNGVPQKRGTPFWAAKGLQNRFRFWYNRRSRGVFILC